MRSITIQLPDTLPPYVPSTTGTLVGTASYADCQILERRLVAGSPIRIDYHTTGQTARVFLLSPTADQIPAGAIGIATMTDEGYWELTSVMC